jgi:hypothetical protein
MECNRGKTLISLEQYMRLLNEESYAHSLMNSDGCMTDPHIQGIGVRVSGNKFKILPPQEFNPLLYRGQNRDYPKLLPGSLRQKSDLDRFTAWAQLTEFLELYQSSPYFSGLSGFKDPCYHCEFEFDLTAIAQHYEFDTPYLDFTRDAAIAMFFAYTKRLANARYIPITDFEADGGYFPTLYVGNLKHIYEIMPEDFRVVGFQAALRPQIQRAICINAGSEHGVDKKVFQRIPLPRSKEMAMGIYEHFKHGATLFPPEHADLLFGCSLLMQGRAIFSGRIRQYCALFPTHDESTLQQELLDSGYVVVNDKPCLSVEAIDMMRHELEQGILPWLNRSIGYRGVAESLNPGKKEFGVPGGGEI